MNSKIYILLLSVFITTYVLKAQHYPYKRYKSENLEFIYGIGCANYLGELGGSNKKGTHKSPIDLECKQTRPAFSFGMRKKLSEYRALKTSISFLQISGDDRLTKETYRQNRNLNFKSNVWEFSVHYEFGFRNLQSGQRYLSRVKGMRNKDHYTYFFAGIGAFIFNPKGNYKGNWYALQPMGTEGQGLNGSKKYKRIAVAIPIGMGFKIKLKQRHYIGIECGYRFTSTDYLDDVSTTYHNNKEISDRRGVTAAHFADPALNKLSKEVTASGEQRGNPKQNDGYFILTINYSKLTYKRKNFCNF